MQNFAILSILAAAGAVSAQSETTTSAAPTPTSACPAAGETNAAGDYGCNPNRDYPGEACALIGDCYVLRGLGGSVTTSAPTPTPTNCPPAGETNAAGDYGCNPNRDYPGEACALIGDCYILRGLGANVTTSMWSNGTSTKPIIVVPTSTRTTVIDGVTTEIPVGPTSNNGGGFVTTRPDGVPTTILPGVVTTGADGVLTTLPPGPVPTGPNDAPTAPTAGAARLSGAIGIVAIAFAAAML